MIRLLILFLFISFFFGLVGLLATVFRVKKIAVEEGESNDRKLTGLDIFEDKVIFFINEKRASDFLFDKNPQLEEITVEKIFPDKIIVKPVIAKPIASLRADRGYFQLSARARVLSKSSKSLEDNLTQINFYQTLYLDDFQVGETVDFREIIIALKALKKINEIGVEVSSVDIEGISVIVFNLKEAKLIFASEKNLDEQLAKFETIYKRLKINGRFFRELDFRFDKPIIKF